MQHNVPSAYTTVKSLALTSELQSTRVAALLALGASPDLDHAAETWKVILDPDVSGQSVIYLFTGLTNNRKTRRFLAGSFRSSYDEVRDRFFGLVKLNE